MDIFSATAAVLRRWYVALPILLLTGYVAFQQFSSAQPTYTSTAYTLLLPPPPKAATPLITDPDDLITPLDPALASLSTSSRFVADLVITNLETAAVYDKLQAQGATAEYELGRQRESSLIQYDVTGDDPAVTARTVDALIAESSAVLTQVQQNLGATTPAVYRLQPAAPVQAPIEVAPERNRALIATVVGGGALAYLLALLVDAALAARRKHATSPAAQRGMTSSSDSTLRPRSGDAEPVTTRPKPTATFRKRAADPTGGDVASAASDAPVGVGSSATSRD